MRIATGLHWFMACAAMRVALRPWILAWVLLVLLPGVQAQEDRITTGAAQGRVLVSDGAQFQPLRRGQVLQAHDRVLLLPGAKTEIRVGADCVLRLQGPDLFIVPAKGACAAPAGLVASSQVSPAETAVAFDGAAFLARTGGLGRIDAEPTLDTVGP